MCAVRNALRLTLLKIMQNFLGLSKCIIMGDKQMVNRLLSPFNFTAKRLLRVRCFRRMNVSYMISLSN